MTTQPVVASVPAGHPYVRRLAPLDGLGPTRLPDPDPDHPDRPTTGRWWPPAMLEPAWVERHDFDLMHLHFGFDARTPQQLRALVDRLTGLGRPLVLTVHDLRSPHQADPRVLRDQLDVLVPAAAAVVTLTASAAREIAATWGREAHVVPHPHLVDLDTMAAVRSGRSGHSGGPLRVGVSAKSVRTNTDPARLLPALGELADQGAQVVVGLHRATHDDPPDARTRGVVEALRAGHAAGALELDVHDPLDDDALWAHVATLDVAVLPYRFGTHSGWLEMCHDLGTSVVAPSLGHYADQGADGVYRADEDDVDTASVVAAVHEAARRRRTDGLPGADAAARRDQRDRVAEAHDTIYADVVRRARHGRP